MLLTVAALILGGRGSLDELAGDEGERVEADEDQRDRGAGSQSAVVGEVEAADRPTDSDCDRRAHHRRQPTGEQTRRCGGGGPGRERRAREPPPGRGGGGGRAP